MLFSLGFPRGSAVKNLFCSVGASGDTGSILGQKDPLEDEMATHSSILAWRIPGTGEPGGLYSIRSQRVRHDWATEYTYRVNPVMRNLANETIHIIYRNYC